MKTTLRFAALAALLATGAFVALRTSLPPRLVFRSPGEQSTTLSTSGFTLRGRVTHDGFVIPGARIKAVPARLDTLLERLAVTDSDGRFNLPGLPEGPARVTVTADRLAPATLSVEVGPATADLAVALEAGVILEARVAEGGAAVEGAQVAVHARGEHRPLRAGVTDSDGRFRLEGLDPAGDLRLVILAEGRRPFETTLRTPGDCPAELNLVSGLQIDGRVTTTDGMPVGEVEVVASQGEGYTAVGRSRDTGDVRIGGLIGRAISLRVLKDGFAPARLDLPSPSSGWTIVLRRTGALAGRGPAGSFLVIETGGATYRRGMGSDGRFRWDGLPPGPAEARATDGSGRVLASRRVEIPEGGVADGVVLLP
jgi:hypothetical protein